MSKSDDYEDALVKLQIELVRMQQWAIEKDEKILVIFEGRDGAGKDGAIKRITEHLAARNTRVVALPKPSDRERSEWWFQRYARHLPAAGAIGVVNRSWDTRAGVEVVMGFSSSKEQEDFIRDTPAFERMLVESGIRIVKFWLDISKKEQALRLEARRTDPLKVLKVSSLDAVAQEKWKDYSKARDAMLTRSHTAFAPWIIVHTDHKKTARLNTIRHLLHAVAPAHVTECVERPDPEVVFPFETAALGDGRLEK